MRTLYTAQRTLLSALRGPNNSNKLMVLRLHHSRTKGLRQSTLNRFKGLRFPGSQPSRSGAASTNNGQGLPGLAVQRLGFHACYARAAEGSTPGWGTKTPLTPAYHMVQSKLKYFLKLKTKNKINKDLGLMVLNTAESSHNTVPNAGQSRSSFQSLPRDLVSTYCMPSLIAQSVKPSACSAGDPGSGRSHGEENGNPLQYSCLENPMDEEPGGLQSMGSQELDTT